MFNHIEVSLEQFLELLNTDRAFPYLQVKASSLGDTSVIQQQWIEKSVVQAITAINCPAHTLFFFHVCDIKTFEIIINELQSDKCKNGIYFNFDTCELGNQALFKFSTLLNTGKCPNGLSINLSRNDIDNHGVWALSRVLSSGNCPPGLSVDLSYNNAIDCIGVEAIAGALLTGKCPANLSLTLNFTSLADMGVKAIAHALESGKCPRGLKLSFNSCHFGSESFEAIAKALVSGKCPENLQLSLCMNRINHGDVAILADAIASGECPDGLILGFTSIYEKYNYEDIKLLSKAIKSGNAPKYLSLNIALCKNIPIISDWASEVAKALKSGQCPEGLELIMGPAFIYKGVTKIIDALKSGKCPKNLRLNFEDGFVDDDGVIAIAQALISGNCPQGLYLDLSYNPMITDKSIKALAIALQSGKCPEGLNINLAYTAIGDAGALLIASVLEKGNCPRGFTITMSESRKVCHEKGQNGIVLGIIPGKSFPITDVSAYAIAQGLATGQYPADLTMILSDNCFSIDGIKAIEQALNSERCPKGLRLNLNHNGCQVNYEKGIFEKEQVSISNGPEGAFSRHLHQDLLISIENKLRNNSIQDAYISCIAYMHVVWKMQLSLGKVFPNEVLKTIFSRVFPFSLEKEKSKNFVDQLIRKKDNLFWCYHKFFNHHHKKNGDNEPSKMAVNQGYSMK